MFGALRRRALVVGGWWRASIQRVLGLSLASHATNDGTSNDQTSRIRDRMRLRSDHRLAPPLLLLWFIHSPSRLFIPIFGSWGSSPAPMST
ncbi:hypothetical protein EDB80DRAFT_716733 [Ilyonectria destructans]|nr:hypothetical protein EDB80DRAFT_716733 [Ilyonectria destructans]